MNNIFISCKESRIENNRSFYGCYYLGPFEEGQSLTIANALRRTLLSECSGLGIISVLIDNVNHEYTTLVGVRDSILDITLNLKEIVLKKVKNPWYIYKKKNHPYPLFYDKVGSSFFKPIIGYLRVKGPGVVRAKDLRLPPFIQCVDPEQYIATLAEDGILNLKCVIMEGKGYIIQKANHSIDFSKMKKRRLLYEQLNTFLSSQISSKFETQTSYLTNAGNPYFPRDSKNPPFFHQVTKELGGTNLPVLSEVKQENQKNSKGIFLEQDIKKEGEKGGTRKPRDIKKRGQVSPNFFPESLGEKKRSENNSLANRQENNCLTGSLGKTSKKNVEVFKKLFKKASALNIDTVFSPVTKVNYTVEVNDNKLYEHSNERFVFLDNIITLLESNYFIQENLPFLTTALQMKSSTKNQTSSFLKFDSSLNSLDIETKNKETITEKSKTKMLSSANKLISPQLNELLFKNSNNNPCILENAKFVQKLIESIDLFSISSNLPGTDSGNSIEKTKQGQLQEHGKIGTESLDKKQNISNYLYSLQPLKKEGLLHTLILEIWTNGSLHPREALSLAFTNLASLFLKLQKTKIYNSMYQDSSSLQKTLTTIANYNPMMYGIATFSNTSQSAMSLSEDKKKRDLQENKEKQDEKTKIFDFLANNENLSAFARVSLPPSSPPCFPLTEGKGDGGRDERDSSSLKIKDMDISFLNLNLRTYTLLKRQNIKTIEQLLLLSEKELFNTYKIDKDAINYISRSLHHLRIK